MRPQFQRQKHSRAAPRQAERPSTPNAFCSLRPMKTEAMRQYRSPAHLQSRRSLLRKRQTVFSRKHMLLRSSLPALPPSAFQPSSLPAFQPSSLPTFLPSCLPAFPPSRVALSNVERRQAQKSERHILRPEFLYANCSPSPTAARQAHVLHPTSFPTSPEVVARKEISANRINPPAIASMATTMPCRARSG